MNNQFAKKKISQFDKAETISETALVPIVQNCDNYTMTVKQLSTFVSSTIQPGVQSDWEVKDTSSLAYIKNKPNVYTVESIDDIINRLRNDLTASSINKFYTKDEVNTIVNNTVTDLKKWFSDNKIFITDQFNKTVLDQTEFELDLYVNTSYDRDIRESITLKETDKSKELVGAGTVCTIGFTNISNNDIVLTIPNTGNNKVMMENTITLKPNEYVEIALKGSNTKRIWTYLKQVLE